MEPIVRNPYLFKEIVKYLPIFELEALGEIENDIRLTLTSSVFDEVKLEALIRWVRGYEKYKNLKVVRLDEGLWLSHNQLTRIPESIGRLHVLRRLGLSNNQLTSLPESIGGLTALRELWLHENQLTILPESIGSLKALQKLWLSNNKLNCLPESILKLQALKYLAMSHNQFTRLPKSIGKLHALWLRGNQLTSFPRSLNREIIQDDRDLRDQQRQ